MEKLVFLFGRKDGTTPDEFRRHYLEVHAPLGLRTTRVMQRYVVNLRAGGVPVGAPFEIDAVTEVWVESVAEFMDPATSFVDADAAAELFADHASFIGPMHAYRVAEEGPPPGSPAVGLTLDEDQDEGGDGSGAGGVNRVLEVVTPDSPAFRSIVLGPPREGALPLDRHVMK